MKDTLTAPAASNIRAVSAGGSLRYSYYALVILMLASVFNYLDRYIVSIMAEDIRTDLRLSDADLGFLMGTAFAVFYSIIGMGAGRVADALPRTKLAAVGLALWSAMTALSAASFNFVGLAATRAGVGIGEATANPCAQSLVTQYFPPSKRAQTLSLYLSGALMGNAVAMIVGGVILRHWPSICHTVPLTVACTIRPWKVAFLVCGLPGLLLAVLAWA
jgi:MFS family permease